MVLVYRFSVFNKNMRAERFLSFSPIEINISRFYSFAERCGNIFFTWVDLYKLRF